MAQQFAQLSLNYANETQPKKKASAASKKASLRVVKKPTAMVNDSVMPVYVGIAG